MDEMIDYEKLKNEKNDEPPSDWKEFMRNKARVGNVQRAELIMNKDGSLTTIITETAS